MKRFGLSLAIITTLAMSSPAVAQQEEAVGSERTVVSLPTATPSPTPQPQVIIKHVPVKVNLKGIRSDIAALKKFRTELLQKPQLTSEQQQLLRQLERVGDLPARLEKLPPETSETYLTQDEQRTLKEIPTLKSEMNSLKGWQLRDYALLSLVLIMLFILYHQRRLAKGINFLNQDLGQFERDSDELKVRVALNETHLQSLQDRIFDVQVVRIADGPQRTLAPLDMRNMSVGDKFDYYLKVKGMVVKYDMAIQDKTEDGKDVLVGGQYFSNIPSRKVHKTLCQKIEEYGGIHPYTALTLVA